MYLQYTDWLIDKKYYMLIFQCILICNILFFNQIIWIIYKKKIHKYIITIIIIIIKLFYCSFINNCTYIIYMNT